MYTGKTYPGFENTVEEPPPPVVDLDSGRTIELGLRLYILFSQPRVRQHCMCEWNFIPINLYKDLLFQILNAVHCGYILGIECLHQILYVRGHPFKRFLFQRLWEFPIAPTPPREDLEIALSVVHLIYVIARNKRLQPRFKLSDSNSKNERNITNIWPKRSFDCTLCRILIYF